MTAKLTKLARVSVFDRRPDLLDEKETMTLLKWGNPGKIPGESREDPWFKMSVIKLLSNLVKWAGSFGPRMVVLLVEHGHLGSEGDPVEALKRILEERGNGNKRQRDSSVVGGRKARGKKSRDSGV